MFYNHTFRVFESEQDLRERLNEAVRELHEEGSYLHDLANDFDQDLRKLLELLRSSPKA